MIPSRRKFLGIMGGLGASALAPSGARGRSLPTIDVRKIGAFGNGKMSDVRALREAIRIAAGRSTGATILFPPGEYFLGPADEAALLTASGLRDVRFVGERATVSCRSVNGQSSMLLFTGCKNVLVEGLTFRDYGLDREINWLGAVAISIGNDSSGASEAIEVNDCSFESVLGAVSCIRSSPAGGRTRGVSLRNLSVRRSYYGLGFQDNGDDVTARGIRCEDVKRSYFPYGVARHDVAIETANNATGFTDVLVKCYRNDTSSIKVKVKSRGKRGGDAIVALDHQHEKGSGTMRNIDVELDVDDADCRLETVVLIRSFDPRAKVETETGNRWERINLDGEVRVCERTKLIEVVTAPRTPGTLRIGRRLAANPRVPARIRGFEVTTGS